MFMLKTRNEVQKENSSPQIFDLLQLSKKERDCRTFFLSAKKNLHRLSARYEFARTKEQKFFLRKEGRKLRREAMRAVIEYRIVRRERVRLFRHYMESLPGRVANTGRCAQ